MVGVIGAMDSEVKLLIENIRDRRQTFYAGTVFCSGKLWGNDVVIAKCGIGKVCAAMCTEVMIDVYHANCVINTGVAGGIAPDLEVGDFVIADKLLQYDFNISALGCVPGYMPCEEFISKTPDKSTPTVFNADKQLVSRLQEAARVAGCSKVHVGTIASADTFLADNRKKAELYNKYSAFATDMEGAAVAQTATLSRVPFAVVRAISDLADKNATISYAEFEKNAAELSATILTDMFRSIWR